MADLLTWNGYNQCHVMSLPMLSCLILHARPEVCLESHTTLTITYVLHYTFLGYI